MGLSTEFPNITNVPASHAVVSCPCGFYCFAEAADAQRLHNVHVEHCEKSYHEPPTAPRTAREVITLGVVHAIQVVVVVCAVGWVWLRYKGMI